jgi:DNA helicase-2/ATP-dependent DNA helicase PcrA
LFVCRMNAPLVGAALKMIAGGVQARVRGKNIATGLVKMIDDASKITVAYESAWRATFTKQLQRLVDVRIETLAAKEHTEVQQETVHDQHECITTFLEGSPDIADAETLKDRLQALFADETAAVWLSSIHKAKGLEADRVFILRPDRIELKHKNMRGWQIEQERNLHYVALTRAKKSLYFVDDQLTGTDKEPVAEKASETVAETVGAHRIADRVAARFSQLDIFNR